MKKIGILFGQENSFPQAFVDRINQKAEKHITAEFVRIDKVMQAEPLDYAVIVDRISQDVPFYRAMLKNAAICGTAVINNPFWWSADDKFFECALSQQLGVAVPKTVVLPTKSYEADIIDESLRNLIYPMPWQDFIDYTGLPAVLKPAVGGGWKNVSIVNTLEELWKAYDASGHLLMILQEFIRFENYTRCFVIGQDQVLVSRYDPSRSHWDRYVAGDDGLGPELRERIVNDCVTLNRALGYDMNTVEFAIRDGIPYAIDFLNPAPDFDYRSITPEYFEWVVQHMADLVIERALRPPAPPADLRWRTMMNPSVSTGNS
jgi:glutathione synthase/RimK-type ligase-like ATP-grasp enzyme